MATSKKFSELPAASILTRNDLAAVAHVDEDAETGYESQKATLEQVGGYINKDLQYATDLSNFPVGSQSPIPAINELRDLIISQIPTKSASGSLVNFTTQLALPLVSLKTEIKATGGGGTPSTPIPIVGVSEVNVYRRGANLWDEEWEVGAYTANGAPSPVIDRIRSKNRIPVVGGTTCYYASGSGNYMFILFFDASGNPLQTSIPIFPVNSMINIPANATCALFYTDSAYGTTYNNDISINYPSTDTSYHAYNPQSDTFTLPLGQTIYGGYVDWELGKATITHKEINLDDISITWDYHSEQKIFRSSEISDIEAPSGTQQVPEWLCEIFSVESSSHVYNSAESYDNSLGCSAAGRLFISYQTAQGDLTTFQTAIAGKKLVYKLATPIEIDLPTTMPNTIQGVQNWFSDAGDIELEYKQDIPSALAEITALALQ